MILLGILFTGVGLIAYPSVSNWYNSYHHSLAVLGYAENVAELDPELLKQVWESAETYNKEVAKN
ncbi:MAG: class C sortase, partial [Lachnospiraceae bacterium]|nr:class C sortase [Lachnospiraceae bacterium]